MGLYMTLGGDAEMSMSGEGCESQAVEFQRPEHPGDVKKKGDILLNERDSERP